MTRPAPLAGLPPFRSIADIPHLHAKARGGKVAVHWDDGSLTYAGLDDRCRRFAAFLASRMAVPGERVGILLPNVPEFVVAYFGAIAAGAVAVPVNTRLSPPEAGYVLSDSGATVLVTMREQYEKLAGLPEAGSVATWILVDGAQAGTFSFDDAIRSDPRPSPAPAAPDDVACLLYTSGTTGFPKGAMISHRNTLFNAASCRATLGYGENDTGLVVVPLFHVTGLHSQLVAHLACGATVVLQREYETRRMLELVSRHGVTCLFLVPAIYKLVTLREDLARYDLSRVRCAAYGGAPMDPETIRAMRRILPAELHNCYGLTESSSLATVLPSELALERSDSVGRAVPGTQAELRDEAGEPTAPGEAGELYLKGPNIVQGYHGAAEKTRQAIRDGWLRTGDIARIDAEGLVTILDRAKDMINRGGEKIYGLEVENVLYAIPGVAEAAVVGVPHPIFGEVPAAFVAPMPGAALDPEGIRRHCAARLADYKIPVEVRFVERLPRNPGGKVVKQALKRAWIADRKEDVR